ncbi:MAG: energy-coupling factor transporter transmembrane protein EcfT [Butyrivibrio sp.]|uniref:energy-coupling factor transporter transmembrane component T family protein n=1 Tax=Butyrivibrio sp. TaxID=28121 RepID=UPI0025E5F146|nr:energy-coupling factor transporter transmembrane component T [Butyrivibrio sp.]MCR5771849.1 energy-coupling factor transporter transmembrane protein EcfT [Butyrivibrio sp.]
MDFTFYDGNKQGLIKVDPRTKFLIFLASGVLTLSSYSDLGVAVYSLFLCAIIALCGKPLTALKAVLPLGVVLYLRMVLQSSKGAPSIIILLITLLSTIFMFGFPMVMSLILIIKTTKISHFLSAFSAMHVPVKIIIPIAVFFRFLPTVADEWSGVRKAMAFRGISLSPIQIICHPFRTIEYVLIPMLFSSISVMEELAASTMARGMDVDIKRTSYEEVKFQPIDYILVLLIIIMTIASIIWGSMIRGGMVS